MFLLVSFLSVLFLASGWLGFRQSIRLEHLNRQNVSKTFAAAVIFLAILMAAHWLGFFPQWLTARVTMSGYTMVAGFFSGVSLKLLQTKRQAGSVEYMVRSFWTDIAPNIISIGLFAFGVYRTGVLAGEFYTGIGITSGLSLIGFAVLGFTVRLVPEFRKRGILLLDQLVEWEKVMAYEWISEIGVKIEYMPDKDSIAEFTTYIPPEDQLLIERLLARKIDEYEQERKKMLLPEEEKDRLSSTH